jgi:hypothetical protein
MNHEILIETEVDGAEPYAALLRRVIPAVLDAERVPFACEVDVLFTDDAGIHAINLEQRGVDRPHLLADVRDGDVVPDEEDHRLHEVGVSLRRLPRRLGPGHAACGELEIGEGHAAVGEAGDGRGTGEIELVVEFDAEATGEQVELVEIAVALQECSKIVSMRRWRHSILLL